MTVARPNFDSLAALDLLRPVMLELREFGWEVNLSVETGPNECVSLAARPITPPQ